MISEPLRQDTEQILCMASASVELGRCLDAVPEGLAACVDVVVICLRLIEGRVAGPALCSVSRSNNKPMSNMDAHNGVRSWA